MAMGFSVLRFLIVVNQHDSGASIAGGIFGILLGAAIPARRNNGASELPADVSFC
jgi:hypothetical protein